MSACLRPDEVIDALDGVLPASRRAHLDCCAACRATLAAVSAALHEARRDEVPEPSPYFWPSINARVSAALAQDAAPGGTRRRWWPLLVPAAALAGLVLALSIASTPRDARDVATAAAIDREPAAPVEAAADGVDDPALALVVDLAALVDDAEPLPLGPIGDLGEMAARTLTVDEQEALQALLRAAVDRPPS